MYRSKTSYSKQQLSFPKNDQIWVLKIYFEKGRNISPWKFTKVPVFWHLRDQNFTGKSVKFCYVSYKIYKNCTNNWKNYYLDKKTCSYISVLELEFWSIYFGFWTYCFISFKLQNAFCRIRRLAALSVLLHKELYFFWRFVLLGFSCIGSFVASGVQLNCAIFFCILLFLVFSWLAVFLFGVLFICWLENPALPRIKADSLNLLNQGQIPVVLPAQLHIILLHFL